ncbi:MAG: sulfotransferase family protein [Telmatospirillum sp.]|nr:sulfotransferase family protein [Telmatospirillum sp.]
MGGNSASYEDFESLAAFVREDSPALGDLTLEPDGKYQTRPVTLASLQREVADSLATVLAGFDGGDFPFLYCGWGKARVGSTALNNLFGLAGLPSFYQPVKAMMRHRLVGSDGGRWVIPDAATSPVLFSKEVGGPYLLAECFYNPVRMLVEAGYPAPRLHLVLLDRRPADCLESWLAKWSDRVPPERLLQHHVLASLNIGRIESYARRQGIPVTHYVYEASRDAVASARALFSRLGLASRFRDDAVTDWRDKGNLDTDGTGVIYPDEPAVYAVPGLHGADQGYRYHARAGAFSDEKAADLLDRCGVLETYRRSVRACVADLNLTAPTAQDLLQSCGLST